MKKTIISIATILIFTSCNGQNNPTGDLKKQAYKNSSSFSTLKKTQGSTESDNIYCMLEDKIGNIWLGTTGEGVYLYNGNTFTQITKLEGLQSNCVYSLLEDNKGVIWIGTSEGLCKFVNGKLEKVSVTNSTYSINTNNNFYSNQSTKNTVWSLLQDKSGKIWVGTGDGVYTYNGKTFKRFLQNDGVINKQNLKLSLIDDMLQDKAGNIWFASGVPPGEDGICVYDGKSIKGFKPNGDSWIRSIIEDQIGNLYFGGRSHGNFMYDGKEFKLFKEKNKIGNPVMVDKSGNIWFNGEEKQSTTESNDGIWRYNGKEFKNLAVNDGLGKYFVWSMLEDRKGNIWIGSRNTELYKFDGRRFVKFSAP